ncbi:hypothetical protein B0H13DRAFT_1903246 [Mycena leptocephala]|nr:hypothetical protein B0H13DRAFT_1903246 [Mycena leptocephala]
MESKFWRRTTPSIGWSSGASTRSSRRMSSALISRQYLRMDWNWREVNRRHRILRAAVPPTRVSQDRTARTWNDVYSTIVHPEVCRNDGQGLTLGCSAGWGVKIGVRLWPEIEDRECLRVTWWCCRGCFQGRASVGGGGTAASTAERTRKRLRGEGEAMGAGESSAESGRSAHGREDDEERSARTATHTDSDQLLSGDWGGLWEKTIDGQWRRRGLRMAVVLRVVLPSGEAKRQGIGPGVQLGNEGDLGDRECRPHVQRTPAKVLGMRHSARVRTAQVGVALMLVCYRGVDGGEKPPPALLVPCVVHGDPARQGAMDGAEGERWEMQRLRVCGGIIDNRR